MVMKSGFSLIELLVVVAIMAMLVGVAAPYYSDYVKESKISKARADLDVLKQSVILYNSREDSYYQGIIATIPPFFPMLGENDFVGLQGKYLTNIPLDPWGKHYKIDPYGGFVFSEGADSNIRNDDIREYYVKDLALSKIEWEDTDGSRNFSANDLLRFQFNKSVWVEGGMAPADFDIYENNQIVDQASATLDFSFTSGPPNNPGYTSGQSATASVLVAVLGTNNTVKLGAHGIAFKDNPFGVLMKYREVIYDRVFSTAQNPRTIVEMNSANTGPMRFVTRTNPLKIVPKI